MCGLVHPVNWLKQTRFKLNFWRCPVRICAGTWIWCPSFFLLLLIYSMRIPGQNLDVSNDCLLLSTFEFTESNHPATPFGTLCSWYSVIKLLSLHGLAWSKSWIIGWRALFWYSSRCLVRTARTEDLPWHDYNWFHFKKHALRVFFHVAPPWLAVIGLSASCHSYLHTASNSVSCRTFLVLLLLSS